jgi:uncharacterized glyoxalase superfamily protein PhnB
MECSCCSRDLDALVALRDREDVRVCRDCLESMLGQVGVMSTPTLPVVDLAEAVRFYERAGFGVRIYKGDDDDPGGGFAFVDFDGQSVFDLDVIDIDPERNGAGCYLIVPEVDGWHARMADAGLPVSPVGNMPWGMREFALTDPFGNNVRIGHTLD